MSSHHVTALWEEGRGQTQPFLGPCRRFFRASLDEGSAAGECGRGRAGGKRQLGTASFCPSVLQGGPLPTENCCADGQVLLPLTRTARAAPNTPAHALRSRTLDKDPATLFVVLTSGLFPGLRVLP